MVAVTTIVLGLLGLAAVGGGLAFLQEITSLVSLIIGNTFYIVLIGVTAFVGGTVLITMVRQKRINPRQALLGFVIVIIATLAVPAAGVEIGERTTNYEADITVNTAQETGLHSIRFENIKVQNIRRDGPDIFNVGQNEACIFCGDWVVNADVTCNNGQWSKTVSLSGQGGASQTKTIEGMPPNSQCQVKGTMTKPDNPAGENPQFRTFVTGD